MAFPQTQACQVRVAGATWESKDGGAAPWLREESSWLREDGHTGDGDGPSCRGAGAYADRPGKKESSLKSVDSPGQPKAQLSSGCTEGTRAGY
jgi:hypothetical protein